MTTTEAIPATVTKATLEASLCRKSFYDFFLRFWSTIIAEPLVPNWHIKYLCDELQKLAERVFNREKKLYDLIINISPGSTKSTIASVMFPAWLWTRQASIRTICGSYAFPLSLHLATQSARIVTSDKFRDLYPELILISESKSLITTSEGGQRIATSTGGSITGMHGHIILIDDPINPKDAISDVALKSANEWFDHTLMSRMIDKSITPVILIMQRLHQNDPTGHQLEKKMETPIRHICLPAEIDPGKDTVRPRSLRKFYMNNLFDPIRLPKNVLTQTEAEMGQYAFAGQYGQSPVPMGGGMFRTDQITIFPSTSRIVRTIRYWDKAGTLGRGAFTVGVLMGIDSDRAFWILDVVRGQWEASERERIIRQTAERDGKSVMIYVEQEPGSGGKESAQATVKNLAGFRIRLDRPVGDKVLRADPYSVQVNGGNVKMFKAIWNAVYLAELQFFPFSKFKDQVDASSGAFAMLTGRKLVVGGIASYATSSAS